jgi:hypothetical protein
LAAARRTNRRDKVAGAQIPGGRPESVHPPGQHDPVEDADHYERDHRTQHDAGLREHQRSQEDADRNAYAHRTVNNASPPRPRRYQKHRAIVTPFVAAHERLSGQSGADFVQQTRPAPLPSP